MTFERSRSRTNQALGSKRRNTKMVGRVCLEAVQMRKRRLAWKVIAMDLGVTRQTLWNHLRNAAL